MMEEFEQMSLTEASFELSRSWLDSHVSVAGLGLLADMSVKPIGRLDWSVDLLVDDVQLTLF